MPPLGRQLLRCVGFSAIALSGACAVPSRAAAAEGDFESLVATKAWTEAEAEARARLSAGPESRAARLDLARVIIEGRQREKMTEAVRLLEGLIEEEPAVAQYHWYLGQALGDLARKGGLSGLGLARRSRRALARAVELEPASFTYVYALNEYLMEAPGIAGGSVSQARGVAEAFARHDREAAALLIARVMVHEGKFAAARERIATVRGREVPLVNIVRRNLLTDVGRAFLAEDRAGEALEIFAALAEEFPNNAPVQLGLGRARLATGDFGGAVAALQRSRDLADNAEVWYRLGVAHEQRGELEDARAAWQQSLERDATGEFADDARRRVAALAADE